MPGPDNIGKSNKKSGDRLDEKKRTKKAFQVYNGACLSFGKADFVNGCLCYIHPMGNKEPPLPDIPAKNLTEEEKRMLVDYVVARAFGHVYYAVSNIMDYLKDLIVLDDDKRKKVAAELIKNGKFSAGELEDLDKFIDYIVQADWDSIFSKELRRFVMGIILLNYIAKTRIYGGDVPEKIIYRYIVVR